MTLQIASFCLASVLSVLLFAVGAWAGETNQCVACHEVEALPISLGHSFEDWRGSAHARGGVGCEKCHGGDPEAADAERAHRGVLPAAESGSLVNRARIPSTCGGCHAKELAAFVGTTHARQLKSDSEGQGATCSTCHGAMATSLPSPAELSARCAGCHKKPVEAQAALLVFASSKLRMRRAYRTLEAMKSSHPQWTRTALDRFHDLEGMYQEIELAWHRLQTHEVVKRSKDLRRLTENLQEEAKIRAEQAPE